ncbi:MAG: cysteine hydrolase [Clostridiales bacterium]|nr:cysteine hydrolase [Clostridiales bacterium]
MMRILIVVDMQKDFINGSLGSRDAEAIVEAAVNKINGFNGDIIVTLDTHFENYMETSEGKNLPIPHCIKDTDGWQLDSRIRAALDKKAYSAVEKITFGSVELPKIIEENYDINNIEIELIGLCTDICVVSNALLLKAHFPEIPIFVDSSCCAGVTPKSHNAALETMRSCQINVI